MKKRCDCMAECHGCCRKRILAYNVLLVCHIWMVDTRISTQYEKISVIKIFGNISNLLAGVVSNISSLSEA